MALAAAGGARRLACVGRCRRARERRSSCVWRPSRGRRPRRSPAARRSRGLTIVLSAASGGREPLDMDALARRGGGGATVRRLGMPSAGEREASASSSCSSRRRSRPCCSPPRGAGSGRRRPRRVAAMRARQAATAQAFAARMLRADLARVRRPVPAGPRCLRADDAGAAAPRCRDGGADEVVTIAWDSASRRRLAQGGRLVSGRGRHLVRRPVLRGATATRSFRRTACSESRGARPGAPRAHRVDDRCGNDARARESCREAESRSERPACRAPSASSRTRDAGFAMLAALLIAVVAALFAGVAVAAALGDPGRGRQ